MQPFLSCTTEGVTLRDSNDTIHGPFVSVDDWKARAPALGNHVLCSSSMDHPDESTDDQDIILLADLLRGNNVSGKNPEFKYALCYDKDTGWDVYEVEPEQDHV